jgi:serine/threonine-protein kinase
VAAELPIGTVVAGCRIDAVAGRGGMGVVYRAEQQALGRAVALKVLAPERAAEAAVDERFGREARMAAAIDHPNVIPVFGAGEEDGRLYIVMRYVDGTDLQALVAEEGPLEPGRAAAIVAQVAAGLDAAHAAGLVHRDVKPANVLIGGPPDDEHVYLTDFGLTVAVATDTRLTTTGQWIGTVGYMAPEQLRAEAVDARTDVYALGCVLFAALTGHGPFERPTVPATMAAHLHEPAPRPSATPGVDPAFDGVVGRALAKRPEERFPSAGDLGRAALAAARGERVTAAERTVARGPAAPRDATPPERVTTHAATSGPTVGPPDEPVTTHAAASGPTVGPPDEPVTTHAAGEAATTHAAAAGTPLAPPAEVARAAGDGGAARETAATRIAGDGDGDVAADGGRPARSRVHRTRRPRTRRPRTLLLATVVAAALLLGAGALAGLLGGGTDPAEPLSAGEVQDVAEAFASAYGDEDAAALAGTLAVDVQRVTPAGAQQGRRAVMAAYRAQFAADEVERYELADLEVRGGRAGRATGRYTVTRSGAEPIEGVLVLGIVRRSAGPRIALISLTPAA